MAAMYPAELRSPDKQAPPSKPARAHRHIRWAWRQVRAQICFPQCTVAGGTWQTTQRSIFNAPERQLDIKLVRRCKHKLQRERRRRLYNERTRVQNSIARLVIYKILAVCTTVLNSPRKPHFTLLSVLRTLALAEPALLRSRRKLPSSGAMLAYSRHRS